MKRFRLLDKGQSADRIDCEGIKIVSISLGSSVKPFRYLNSPCFCVCVKIRVLRIFQMRVVMCVSFFFIENIFTVFWKLERHTDGEIIEAVASYSTDVCVDPFSLPDYSQLFIKKTLLSSLFVRGKL